LQRAAQAASAQVLIIKIHSKLFLLGRSSNMKKCKFIKSGIAIAILGCSIIFTACDVNTDKKVEKQANKVVDAVESKDITKLDAIINGTDEIKADEELRNSLSEEQIRECFNFEYYTKNVDRIFDRVFGK
jgi:hypothetical protein